MKNKTTSIAVKKVLLAPSNIVANVRKLAQVRAEIQRLQAIEELVRDRIINFTEIPLSLKNGTSQARRLVDRNDEILANVATFNVNRLDTGALFVAHPRIFQQFLTPQTQTGVYLATH